MPRLSLVLLTWNEAQGIAECLQALSAQTEKDFEVVLVDAASTDATVEIARRAQPSFPVPLRILVAERRITVGEARNRGVAAAQAPVVAFLSADTMAHPDWVREALVSLERADMVFGRQVHAPRVRTIAAAVRGLRYHFPSGDVDDAALYASHVNAAIRREILLRFPIGTDRAGSAVDDVLLVKRAAAAGYVAAYNPKMVVEHRDADTTRAELRKNWREGLGWGAYAHELGYHRMALAWGGLIGVAGVATAVLPTVWTVLALVGVLWLPAVRRALRRRGMPLSSRAVGTLAAPLFDLAFLVNYLRSLVRSRTSVRPRPSLRSHPHDRDP